MLNILCLLLLGHSSKTSLEDFPWSYNPDQSNPPSPRVPLCLAAQLKTHLPSCSHCHLAFHAPDAHVTEKCKSFFTSCLIYLLRYLIAL